MTGGLIAGGLVAGGLVGAVLRRADLCFHSMFRRAWGRDVDPSWWLVAFVIGIVVGSFIMSATRGRVEWRGETASRLVQLAIGGALLGAGGRIAGGCNLGHGLSGAAQLNVSSWTVVLAMAVGVGLAARVERTPARSARAPAQTFWVPQSLAEHAVPSPRSPEQGVW